MPPPIQVADDLGYNDLGIRNGGKTITPAIDALVEVGLPILVPPLHRGTDRMDESDAQCP